MKDLAEYICEGVSLSLKEKILSLLDSPDITDKDALSIINRLDKAGEESLYKYVQLKGIPEKFCKRIVSIDRTGELSKIANDDTGLPSFGDFITGRNLYDLFSGRISSELVDDLYGIEGSSGTGNIGKGEILLNLFVQGGTGKGKGGDVHILGNSIEIKTTPNAHPGERKVPKSSFGVVIDKLSELLGISKDNADLFFRVRGGKKEVTRLVKDKISGGEKPEDILYKIYISILEQYNTGRKGTDDEKEFRNLNVGEFISGDGDVNIQNIVNLVGSVQTKHYITDQTEKVDYLCIIDDKTMDYKILDRSTVSSITSVLNSGIKFSNSMDKNYSPGSQTSTMKFNSIK
jgi:hypothetical protein